jgi:hypothetical protein
VSTAKNAKRGMVSAVTTERYYGCGLSG